MLKSVAKKALPVVGGALGSMVAPGIGTALGSKLGSMASGLFEVELEGMPAEAAEFEVARRYVNLAAGAARAAALARPQRPVPAPALARAAVATAARAYAPGVLSLDAPVAWRSGSDSPCACRRRLPQRRSASLPERCWCATGRRPVRGRRPPRSGCGVAERQPTASRPSAAACAAVTRTGADAGFAGGPGSVRRRWSGGVAPRYRGGWGAPGYGGGSAAPAYGGAGASSYGGGWAAPSYGGGWAAPSYGGGAPWGYGPGSTGPWYHRGRSIVVVGV